MKTLFSAFRPAVEHILQTYKIEQTTNFSQFVRDELAKITPDVQNRRPDKTCLNALYEMRARCLDWELGTGYLGFFSNNSGTRYTFTRRLEGVLDLLPSSLTQPGNPNTQFRILEIGCGAGLLCLHLAQQAEIVIGNDISHFVLDFANQVKEYIHYENVFFQYGDAECLAFHDDAFDLIICSEVVEHLLSPRNALAEIRRVIKKDGTVILTTPCAVSLSDLCMSIFRIFYKQIESEKTVHFDKKTYLAVKRDKNTLSPGLKKTSQGVDDEIFMRVHERFDYPDLVGMFQQAGFKIEQAVGTVFAFPPHYQVFYRYCPEFVLPVVRLLENSLNHLRVFQRFGSVTTCFRLRPKI